MFHTSQKRKHLITDTCSLIAVGLLAALIPVRPAPAQTNAPPAPPEDDPDQIVYWERPAVLPEAQELLAGVRRALPVVPLRIDAELRAKSRAGDVEGVLRAEMVLHWDPDEPSALYSIRDAFGRLLEKLSVIHHSGTGPTYAYYKGDPPQETGVPDLDQTIQETDISWMDLTLSFLWWPGGETVGAEKIKGRLCYIIDMPVPGRAGAAPLGVRLWIDSRFFLLLQAATYDANGDIVRRLQVKSIKKVDELWVVKDLEVRSYPSRRRTVLHVHTVEPIRPEVLEEPAPHSGK